MGGGEPGASGSTARLFVLGQEGEGTAWLPSFPRDRHCSAGRVAGGDFRRGGAAERAWSALRFFSERVSAGGRRLLFGHAAIFFCDDLADCDFSGSAAESPWPSRLRSTASAKAPNESVAVPKAMVRLFSQGSRRATQPAAGAGRQFRASTAWRLPSWVDTWARSAGERMPLPRGSGIADAVDLVLAHVLVGARAFVVEQLGVVVGDVGYDLVIGTRDQHLARASRSPSRAARR